VDRNYTISGSRKVDIDPPTFFISEGVLQRPTEYRTKVRNDGNKRTAILGGTWKASGFEDEVPEGVDIVCNWMVIENLKNRKTRYSYVFSNSILWIEPTLGGGGAEWAYQGNAPTNVSGSFTLPEPMLVKNADLRTWIAPTSNTLDLVGVRMEWWLADAILKDGMGDLETATRLDTGKARVARVGDKRIEPFSSGGDLPV